MTDNEALLAEYEDLLEDMLPMDEVQLLLGVRELIADLGPEEVFGEDHEGVFGAHLAAQLVALSAVGDAASGERRRLIGLATPDEVAAATLLMKPAASDARN